MTGWDVLEMKGKSISMIIIIMMTMLIGCAAPIEGVVAGKDVDPGRTEEVWRTERRSCGTESYSTTETSNGKSKTVQKSRTKYCDRRIKDYRNVPPSWDLNIRKDDGTLQWVPVSESVYRRIQIGERVNTGNLSGHGGPAR